LEKTLKELCLENSRKYSEEQIQKEHDKEKAYLETCYEKNKEKIEQIREIIIQNSLEGKLEGTIHVKLISSPNNTNEEFTQIFCYLKSIGVKISNCKVSENLVSGLCPSQLFVTEFVYEFE
jgi:hypothetical protein